MPNIKEIRVSYREARSANYQSVQMEKTVSYELQEGEDEAEVFKQVRADLVRDVRYSCDKAIERYAANDGAKR